jgi:hypothetical protein
MNPFLKISTESFQKRFVCCIFGGKMMNVLSLENLGRMTKAAMVNVDFNKKDTSGLEVQMLFWINNL